MSIFSSDITEIDNDNGISFSVAGKISIGTPISEPAAVNKDLVGVKAADSIAEAKLRRGTEIQPKHVKRMREAGVKEVKVFRGKFPTKLDHFQIRERSDVYKGEYIYKPGLHEQFGIEKRPKKIPIVFPIDDIDRMFIRQMKNYHHGAKKMFCSSSGANAGVTAQRAIVRNGNFTGQTKEVECIPFYDDPRGPICPFRNKDRKEGKQLPCKFSAAVYVNVLTEDISTIDVARFFKFETTSPRSAKYIAEGLKNIRKQYGRIAWIPCQLELKFESATTSDGITTDVPRVGISANLGLLDKYGDIINRAEALIEKFSIGANIEIDDETSEEAFDAEFRPTVANRELYEQGVIDDEDLVEDEDENAPAGSAINPLKMAEDPTFEHKIKYLDSLAKQTPPEQYVKYTEKRENLSPSNISERIERVESYLERFSEEEKQTNWEENTAL